MNHHEIDGRQHDKHRQRRNFHRVERNAQRDVECEERFFVNIDQFQVAEVVGNVTNEQQKERKKCLESSVAAGKPTVGDRAKVNAIDVHQHEKHTETIEQQIAQRGCQRWSLVIFGVENRAFVKGQGNGKAQHKPPHQPDEGQQ